MAASTDLVPVSAPNSQEPPEKIPESQSKNKSTEHNVGISVDKSIDCENEVTGLRLLLIHISICLCTFLVGLDFNVIATAVPVITSHFDSIEDVGWYGAAFQLALSSTQPFAGKVYTLFPKKYVYLISIFIFGIGSLVSALAPTSKALIVGRAITGLGASGIFAGGFAVLTSIIPLHKRAIWTGTMSSTFSLASIIGPIMGGALTQRVSWRWCFYINLPIGGFAALLFFVLVHLQPAETERQPLASKFKSLDAFGLSLFSGAMIMLLLALNWGGQTYAWHSPIVIGLLAGSGVTFLLFVPWQLHMGDNALVPPRLFAVHRNVWLIFLSSFFVNGPFQLIIYWLPIWFQAVLRVSPTQSGIDYFPTVVSDVLAAFIGSAIVMKLGYWNPFLLFGEAMVCIGGGLLSTLYRQIPDGRWIGYQIFGGIGYSLVTNLAHLGMQATLPQDLVPIGASNLLAVISMSCSIFLAIGEAVFQKRLEVNLAPIESPRVIGSILHSGATDIASVVNETQLQSVLDAYSKSVTQVFYIPAAAPVLSFFLVCGCTWISVKKSAGSATRVNDLEAKSRTDTSI